MIPILYESNETAFTSNGLGRLRDCIDCKCSEERNGIYEVDFSYPVDGANYDLIQCGRTVAVTHDDSGDIQPFDIVSYTKPIDGVVKFHAVHVSYRQSGIVAQGTGINSLADALSMLTTSAQPSNPFTYEADFTSNAYMASADGTPRSVRQLLGGVEGSILDAYGGEYEFDRFRVILHRSRGVARDFVIRYGVNMLDFTDDTDYQSIYTSCIPYWKGADSTGAEVVVYGNRVDSGAVSYNGRNVCSALDLSDKFEEPPTTAQLESMAQTYMNAQQTYMPHQSIKVDFVRLQDMGYEGLDNLLQCNLCDTITVEFPDYSMQGQFKIVKTVWDALEERYTAMELGTLSVSLADALGIQSQAGALTVGGHSSQIGILLVGSETISVPSTTGALIRRGNGFSLDAGTWGIIMSVTFPANNTGFRRVAIGASDGMFAAGRNSAAATGGYETPVLSTTIVAPTSTTTYYAYIHHNAGTTLSVVVNWRAVRIA